MQSYRPLWAAGARVVVCLAAAASLLGDTTPSAAPARTSVVLTFDVESNEEFRLPDQLNAVCEDAAPCGLTTMVGMLQRRGWPGTFFLNVYEHKKFGEDTLRNIAIDLRKAGQDVALHTHPADAYDETRTGMRDYTLQEQVDIVRDGVRLLQAWTGEPVLSHRAGAYAADRNTLEALAQNRIPVDSSVFWRHPKTLLDDLGMRRNVPSVWDGRLVQIPVTVFEREDRPFGLSRVLEPIRSVRKIDADWLTSEAEMRGAIDAAVDAEFPVIVVFLHSFSFIHSRTERGLRMDRDAAQMFEAILDHIARRNLPVVTMRDLAQTGRTLAATSPPDAVPVVPVSVDIPRYVWRRYKADPRDVYAAGAGLAILCLAAFLPARRLAIAVRRKRRSAAATATISGATVTEGRVR
jgi:peptidoglycan/xylan/chitin deacetylase (PgdA/CDA1 family)